MLEGKELEGKIGNAGTYSVDVDVTGMVKAEIAYGMEGIKTGAFVEIELLMLLEKWAAKTGNTIDDSLVAALKKAAGKA